MEQDFFTYFLFFTYLGCTKDNTNKSLQNHLLKLFDEINKCFMVFFHVSKSIQLGWSYRCSVKPIITVWYHTTVFGLIKSILDQATDDTTGVVYIILWTCGSFYNGKAVRTVRRHLQDHIYEIGTCHLKAPIARYVCLQHNRNPKCLNCWMLEVVPSSIRKGILTIYLYNMKPGRFWSWRQLNHLASMIA